MINKHILDYLQNTINLKIPAFDRKALVCFKQQRGNEW